MIESFIDHLGGVSRELITVVLAAMPLSELRGSIPWATFVYKFTWQKALWLSLLGNVIPLPFVLLLLRPVEALLSRSPLLARFMEWLFARTRRKGKLVERYEALGLMLFVAIPLPVTGGWTGALAAHIFGIRFVPALIALLAGITIAGVLVTLACQGLLGFWDIGAKFVGG